MTADFDWEDLFRREEAIRRKISEWQRIGADSASDLNTKEQKLLEYGQRLDRIQQEYHEQLEATIAQLPGVNRADRSGGAPKANCPSPPEPSHSESLPTTSEDVLTGITIEYQSLMRTQEDIILRVISRLGYEPGALPPRPKGRPWVKAEVKKLILEQGIRGISFTEKNFDLAWERLRTGRKISESPD